MELFEDNKIKLSRKSQKCLPTTFDNLKPHNLERRGFK